MGRVVTTRPVPGGEQWGVSKVLGLIAAAGVLGLFVLFIASASGSKSLEPYRLPDGTIDQMALGEAVYAQTCVECHQNGGVGKDGLYPPLSQSPWLVKDPETPVRILLGGLSGEIRVNGKRYYGSMPSWRQLDDERIAAVLTYARQSFGNDAEPVPPTLVAELRPFIPVSPWSASKLEKLRD